MSSSKLDYWPFEPATPSGSSSNPGTGIYSAKCSRGAIAHDAALDVFMTLPAYTSTREGEARQRVLHPA